MNSWEKIEELILQQIPENQRTRKFKLMFNGRIALFDQFPFGRDMVINTEVGRKGLGDRKDWNISTINPKALIRIIVENDAIGFCCLSSSTTIRIPDEHRVTKYIRTILERDILNPDVDDNIVVTKMDDMIHIQTEGFFNFINGTLDISNYTERQKNLERYMKQYLQAYAYSLDNFFVASFLSQWVNQSQPLARISGLYVPIDIDIPLLPSPLEAITELKTFWEQLITRQDYRGIKLFIDDTSLETIKRVEVPQSIAYDILTKFRGITPTPRLPRLTAGMFIIALTLVSNIVPRQALIPDVYNSAFIEGNVATNQKNITTLEEILRG